MKKKTKSRKKSAAATKNTALLILGIIITLIALLVVLNHYQKSSLPGEYYSSQGNEHIPNENAPHDPYNSDPPTSGPHTPHIAKWGIHEQAVPFEILVHNLEDGGIVIYYNSDATTEEIAALSAITMKYNHIVQVPYPTMEAKVTLTAWQHLLRLDSIDTEKIEEFVNAHIGNDHHPRK
jgi:hypothetical protein